MTILKRAELERVYVNPGTDDDGYVEPTWKEAIGRWFWHGGAGDWFYVGHVGSGSERVSAFRYGAEEVERLRVWAEALRKAAGE